MRRAFVDTSAFFALAIADDASHAVATELFRRAARHRWRLVTSNAVVSECYTLLRTRSRHGWRNATAFLQAVASDRFHVERVSPGDEHRAAEILRANEEHAFSFCDATSFAIVERFSIEDVLTFDADFLAYGRFIVHCKERPTNYQLSVRTA